MEHSIEAILCYMREYPDENIERIAERFGYSKFHFSREFKRLTGFSAKQFVSALKMEKSIENLVNKKRSVLSAHLQAGFLSASTFSSSFKKQTGMTPKQYQKQLEELHRVLVEYESNRSIIRSHYGASDDPTSHSECIVNLHFPKDYTRGITFVGLFRQPIPNHRPIVGKAVVGNTICILDRIPKGQYYLLSCSIEKGSSLTKYFVMKDCLRARVDEALIFPKEDGNIYDLYFRGPLPQDPPITINLGKLLADGLYSFLGKNE